MTFAASYAGRLLTLACALCATLAASSAEIGPKSSLLTQVSGLPSLSSAIALEKELPTARAADVVEALLAIRGKASPEVRGAVVKCLLRTEPTVVQVALGTLPLLQPGPADLAQVRTLLSSQDPVVRTAAIKCSADTKDRLAIPLLAASLSDRIAAKDAHDALVKIAGRNLGSTEIAWIDWYAAYEEKIKQALSTYSDRLRSSDDAEVIMAINQLMQLDAEASAKGELIEPLMNSSNPDVAATACMAVKKCDPTADVSPPDLVLLTRANVDREAMGKNSQDKTAALMRSTSFIVLGAVALGLGLMGALIFMIFLLRTKEVIAEATRRLTRRIGKGTRRIGKGAKHWTQKVIKAIKKKITFIP